MRLKARLEEKKKITVQVQGVTHDWQNWKEFDSKEEAEKWMKKRKNLKRKMRIIENWDKDK